MYESKNESKKANLITSYATGSILVVYGMYVTILNLSAFGTDCKELISMIQDSTVWSSFLAQLKDLTVLKDRV